MNLAPVIVMEREEFLRMFRNGVTMRALSFALGMNEEEMALALLQAQHEKHHRYHQERTTRRLAEAIALAKPETREPNKVWCGQCERLCAPAEFMTCRKAFCKAKEAA